MCRNFPTKQALVEAVVGAMYETLLRRGGAALADPDPARAFEQFVIGLPDVPGPASRARRSDGEREHARRRRGPRDKLLRAVSELVARAQAAGAIRSDIGPGDVSMLFSGVAHATAVAGELQPVLRERFVRIILDGLRAEDPTELPGRPLDFAQVRRMSQRRAS